MSLPRIILVVPLLLLGLFAPPVGAAPAAPPVNVLGMLHEAFARPDAAGGRLVETKAISLGCGQTLTMQNSSRWVHIIGPGRKGIFIPDQGVPISRRALVETDEVYRTQAWNTTGTHYLTCAVHPEMTVKVVVSCCTRCASG